jgi:hypothetical protein
MLDVLAGTDSSGRDPSAKAEGASPKAAGASPKAEGASPKAEGASPKAEGASPKAEGASAGKANDVALGANGSAEMRDGAALQNALFSSAPWVGTAVPVLDALCAPIEGKSPVTFDSPQARNFAYQVGLPGAAPPAKHTQSAVLCGA